METPSANRRNLAALALVVLVVALALLVPHWTTRYAAGLVIFTVWMAWFVETLAEFLGSDRDL